MSKALSVDLRERVVAAVEAGSSCPIAAARFGVGISSAIRWASLKRSPGSVAPGPLGGRRRSGRNDVHAPPILGLLKRRADIRAAIEVAGARLLYLPPCSAGFNPVENAFATLKAMLRKAAERTIEGLWSAIGRIIDTFKPTECANYCAATGYNPG